MKQPVDGLGVETGAGVNRTAPNEKMSMRASASLPSICSGDMYRIVPTMLPTVVSGLPGLAMGVAMLVVCAADKSGAADEPGAPDILGSASPKSINFAPDFVSMMLPGFRSR